MGARPASATWRSRSGSLAEDPERRLAALAAVADCLVLRSSKHVDPRGR